MEVMKKLEALQNSAEFEQELEMVGSPEELQKLFKKHGVDLTKGEIESLLASVSKQTGDELSDVDLDGVAGGSFWGALWLAYHLGKWKAKHCR